MAAQLHSQTRAESDPRRLKPIVCEVLHRHDAANTAGGRANYADIVLQMEDERVRLGQPSGKEITINAYAVWLVA
jgi:hypothetical protein